MKFIYIIVLIFFTQSVKAQETLSSIIKENTQTFILDNNEFTGKGWNEILGVIKAHNNILIGEDHFFNEIPLFISKINNEVKFDNFFCEIDPYTATILETKINKSSTSDLNTFTSSFSNTFSFFALEPEFNLLKKLVQANTKIIGTDQISLLSDRLIISELKERSNNKTAKSIYSEIEKKSAIHFDQIINGKKPYFLTNEFTKQLYILDSLVLSSYEQTVLKNLKLSQNIYSNGNHHLRVQLMKHNLMENYKLIPNSKNLYKYGAGHLPKGESLLKIQDIGNLVNNITDSQFESSLHIMIIGKSGIQGVPIKGMENQKLNPNSKDLKHYKVYFDTMDKNKWYVFNNKEILKKITSNKIKIEDKTLERVIKGYDYFIIIPKVTPAKFIN
ncbi:hypothetical protein KO506_13005 [Polaribacter vadi]|uniref:hypothetical protein n=1 Tax=Polaribacter TaxID=52959 RepID=UPI001C090D1C|nr:MULTISPECIES: hypothetical protein [Polaribacter]MBU3012328.1 hypothetical protein [Polaribacter vadi]MDO6742145.1 hypothetical protein [Polaribacter sp. 1_MG-2023]